MGEMIKAFKGFDENLRCRGFQYEIGKEYEEETASLCNRGFHACEHPLDVLGYYPPADSRYCEVEIEATDERTNEDTKICGTKIKIGAEIGIKGLIKAAFQYTKERCINSEQGADSSALTGGYSSALTGGDRSALTGGDSSALTGGRYSVVYGGEDAKVRGGKGSVLALQYWKFCEFKGIKFKEVDGVKIKENTYYRLDARGRFIEASK